MTEKIYEKQSYLKEYKTVVTECVKENGLVYIKLQKTIFFPEEGGQYSDTGTITCKDKTIHVLRGELLGSPTEGETDIRYETDGEIEPGSEVLCKLDWDIRFDRMQNHSGEHILSGLLHSTFGYNNTGFHLSDTEPVTVDTGGMLDAGQIKDLERQANLVIYENLPIIDSYPSKEALNKLTYRSKIDIKAQVRLITIGDENRTIDVCACCAPHVSNTGAIGLIKIISAEKFRGGTRLSILCGRRAYEYVVHDLEQLDKAARIFSANADTLPELASAMKEENLRLNARNAELTESLIIRDITAGTCKNAVFTDMDLNAVSMKNIFNTLKELRKGFCGVFAGNDGEGYRYYAGGKDLDARIPGQKMKEELDAKGGGSAEMIQGKTTASKDRIEALFERVNQGTVL